MSDDGFTAVDVIVGGETPMADLDRDKLAGGVPHKHGKETGALWLGQIFRIAALPRGTGKGLPSVCVAIKLPDGTIALGETTARLFVAAAAAIRGRFPEIDAEE